MTVGYILLVNRQRRVASGEWNAPLGQWRMACRHASQPPDYTFGPGSFFFLTASGVWPVASGTLPPAIGVWLGFIRLPASEHILHSALMGGQHFGRQVCGCEALEGAQACSGCAPGGAQVRDLRCFDNPLGYPSLEAS